MNFDQLHEQYFTTQPPTNEIFLDTVYDSTYYPEFLESLKQIDDHLLWQRMETYVETGKFQPVKHIEANYMIEPNI
jgi:hypothetical protein